MSTAIASEVAVRLARELLLSADADLRLRQGRVQSPTRGPLPGQTGQAGQH